MRLKKLSDWMLDQTSITEELVLLQRFFAAHGVANLTSNCDNLESDLKDYKPNWQKLIPAASIFAQCQDERANDNALLIAHSGLLYSDDELVKQASIKILSDARNQRAINMLKSPPSRPIGALASLSQFKNKIDSEVTTASNLKIDASRFQSYLWKMLNEVEQLAVSAPTASGKTFIVLQWMLSRLQTCDANLIVFLAPTRALVGEIERQLFLYSKEYTIQNLRISSLPFGKLGDGTQPTILVFTQERLHVFLNAIKQNADVDILVVDEAQKISEGQRGIVLQEAIEKLKRLTSCERVIQLSPLTENPKDFFSGDTMGKQPQAAVDDRLMVTQNLIFINNIRGKPRRKSILLRKNGNVYKLGEMDIDHQFGQSKPKNVFAAAYAVGKDTSGTLVYADGRVQAEKIAILLADSIEVIAKQGTELFEFSSSIRQMIHPKYALKDVVLKGVGFHYGNMPTLVRDELERLFREHKLKFLVCTSTLVEGVNLAAKSIVTMGPRKGHGIPMEGHDFWNLAGRAGRWGQDLFGNVICVQASNERVWNSGVPERKKYRIEKATTKIFSTNPDGFVEYLTRRLNHQQIVFSDGHYEYLFAYWLGKYLNREPVDMEKTENHISKQAGSKIREAAQAIIDIDVNLAVKHPGVSAWALQKLYNYFESETNNIEQLIPRNLLNRHESVKIYFDLFAIVNEHVFPAFEDMLLYPYALTTSRWMHGSPLSMIIKQNEDYYTSRKRDDISIAQIIRDTMSVVEEISRFRAPKYLSAYLDVLQKYLVDTERTKLYPDTLKLDLFLEFGVATKTLLSLISIGLSRTSALALNEHISNDHLSELDVTKRLVGGQWEGWQLPLIVRREVKDLIHSRSHILTREI